jgi:hypothetical protein
MKNDSKWVSKENIKIWIKKPVYPMLFFIYPGFHWFAFNLKENLPLYVLPLLILLGLMLYGLVNLIVSWFYKILIKSKDIKALNLLFFGVWFFSFGRIWLHYYEKGQIPREISSTKLILVSFGIFAGLCLVSFILPKNMSKLNQFFNVIVISLLISNSGWILFTLGNSFLLTEAKQTHLTIPQKPYKTPNIYYLIFDEMANPETMKIFYNTDTSGFVNTLEEMGFFVAKNSHSVSIASQVAIGSTLSLGYEPASFAYSGVETALSKVVKALGYQYIHVGTSYEMAPIVDFLMYNEFADTNYNFKLNGPPSVVSEAVGYLMKMGETTALKTLPFLIDYSVRHKNNILGAFDYVQNTIPQINSQKFVFAHFLTPHKPFLFYKQPKKLDPTQGKHKENAYIGQYVYVTEEIIKTVRSILEKENTPPIIILQSDHGLRSSPESLRIFNAIYIPEDMKIELSHDITPLDTIKIVLEEYIGLDLNVVFNKENTKRD